MDEKLELFRSEFMRMIAGATVVGSTGIAASSTQAAAEDSSDPDDLDVDPIYPLEEDTKIDQVGYLPKEPKIGMVTIDATTFHVRDAVSDESVYTGELSDPISDANSGDTVRHADFSSVTIPGEYVLDVEDTTLSYDFTISDGVFDTALMQAGRVYTLMRSGMHLDDPLTGAQYAAGHEDDAEAELFFSDDYYDEGDSIDVSGGWYDAGDYGKYIPPASVTVGQLLLTYEQYSEKFGADQFCLPHETSDSDEDLPDLLREVKFNLEWMERMQRPDGGIYHKVAGDEFPDLDVTPSEDTQQRYVFGFSTFGTGFYAGAMAMASRIYEEYDEAFAERLLSNAQGAYQYLQDNPDPEFRFDEGQDSGSGPYRKDTDDEERLWAAAELLKTTNDPEYDEYLTSSLTDQLEAQPTTITWSDARTLGLWAYYTSDENTTEFAETIQQNFREYADDLVEHINEDGYRVALETDEYVWSSTKIAVAKGMNLLLANEITADQAYVNGALDQLHYAFGRNTNSTSYMTGAGNTPARNVHDRIMVSTGYYLPGHVVGGPNAQTDNQDPILQRRLAEESPAPAEAYYDDVQSYATNEFAIDYTAPVVFVLAHFASSDPELDELDYLRS
ncbi:glycoside hydrolase family 9 protein [Halalkalicoccus tibetensis]|uniref:Glycoside hydrolase family 9 protein n=1 Tax=Halalkalicoccus tibetensis TaxID=175632 RepID=A0ABD5VD77_9EURY